MIFCIHRLWIHDFTLHSPTTHLPEVYDMLSSVVNDEVILQHVAIATEEDTIRLLGHRGELGPIYAVHLTERDVCVYVCMCVCMYVCMYVCVCVYVCMYVPIYMYVCMYNVCMYVWERERFLLREGMRTIFLRGGGWIRSFS